MANRRLSPAELHSANELLREIRTRIKQLSGDDTALQWALRRKIYKELSYDERGKPMHRRKLKQAKHREQHGVCPVCREPLPETYTVLDRHDAMRGYTAENTRLIHPACDTAVQRSRGYA